MTFNAHNRDEFLRALEEARRASLGEAEEQAAAARARNPSRGSVEFLRTLESMAGRVKSYISTRILAGLYAEPDPVEPADATAREEPVKAAPPEPPPPPPPPPKSDQETVAEELHLTPGLTADDLKHLRRKFAKSNHPDRVDASAREQATRRMTIANVLIDEALRSKRAAR
jgi:hypothetical protein